ncbi:hypothetical protein CLHUN_04760 [Ruminiclostridium hungatei]|uniref:Uncharacterized protein n=1 Tax=Ruminiclostridium hungatei TaxID=48256 RepID=A0A1V4SRT1_RUMHU|nr:hypothetical protein [Ruminiclostridium hungatei]OPX46001.1 hypothetical protein CLHUN_04760 [Ruminiclostridium hungatei]
MLLLNKIRLISFSLIACFAINSLPCYASSIPTNINVDNSDEGAYFEPEKPQEGSLDSTTYKLSDLNQKVEIKAYSITVPSKWKVKTDGIETEFYIGDKKVGEVARYGYLTYGNHYELLYEKHLQGFSTDVLMVKLARSLPAAANDDTITEELHFYLPLTSSNEKLNFGTKEVYDIKFFTGFVQEDTALEIIKTFRYK